MIKRIILEKNEEEFTYRLEGGVNPITTDIMNIEEVEKTNRLIDILRKMKKETSQEIQQLFGDLLQLKFKEGFDEAVKQIGNNHD